MRQATSTPFITTSTHILSRQRTRKTVNNMKMSTYVIIHQVNSFFRILPGHRNICSRNSIPRKQRSCTVWNVLGISIARVLLHRATDLYSSKRLTMGRVLYPRRYDSQFESPSTFAFAWREPNSFSFDFYDTSFQMNHNIERPTLCCDAPAVADLHLYGINGHD